MGFSSSCDTLTSSRCTERIPDSHFPRKEQKFYCFIHPPIQFALRPRSVDLQDLDKSARRKKAPGSFFPNGEPRRESPMKGSNRQSEARENICRPTYNSKTYSDYVTHRSARHPCSIYVYANDTYVRMLCTVYTHMYVSLLG